jgi:hypothetical protein
LNNNQKFLDGVSTEIENLVEIKEPNISLFDTDTEFKIRELRDDETLTIFGGNLYFYIRHYGYPYVGGDQRYWIQMCEKKGSHFSTISTNRGDINQIISIISRNIDMVTLEWVKVK